MLDAHKERELRQKLDELQQEHRDLDLAIHALTSEQGFDQFAVKRLKKRKLLIKDMAERIQSRLIPDLNA